MPVEFKPMNRAPHLLARDVETMLLSTTRSREQADLVKLHQGEVAMLISSRKIVGKKALLNALDSHIGRLRRQNDEEKAQLAELETEGFEPAAFNAAWTERPRIWLHDPERIRNLQRLRDLVAQHLPDKRG